MNIRRSSPTLSEADADALLSGRALTGHDDLREIIGLMRTASAVPAPTPNAVLAAMLDTGFAPLTVASAPIASRGGRWSLRLAAATAVAMTATLGAATANALPAPIQTAVANVVGAVTPLQLPRPPAGTGTGNENRDGSSDEPPVVPDEQPNRNAEMGADEQSGESADTDEPDTDEPDTDEPDTDEPDTDEPDTGLQESDEPDTDEPDTGLQESDEPDTDELEQPDSVEVEQGDADGRDLLDSDEPELDTDEAEQDEPDANA